MSFWVDLAKNTLKHAARGLASGMTGKVYTGRRPSRQSNGHEVTDTDLRQFIEQQRIEHEKFVEYERAKGNNIPRTTFMREGWLGNERAIVRWQRNAELGTMEIFYGGTGSNPLDNRDHGHVVIKNGVVVSWQEPGAQGSARNRLY